MPIVLLRIDERLIHGQVVVGWGERLHMDRIVVVDDELAASAWEQELYCLGVPPTVDASFVGVDEARHALPSWRTDPRRIVVLLRDAQTLARLSEDNLLEGMEVNLGGIHSAPGRVRVLPYLFLSDADRSALNAVAASGATIAARDLPASRAVPLGDLLNA
ncbi:MAG TPA: PTS sugar transporter subunit IIB [Longimicrobiaceae bacterium]|jgi:PTS system mannose-specific IIB component/fructoselysine and glucoselysine-specific PTS system IIB component|nr:PTS sugar transporter subunit IIB [Longimicrobiaceae bacterium]